MLELIVVILRCAAALEPGQRILVIGGSGRVGGSTVRWLHRMGASSGRLLVGGRDRRNFDAMVERWRRLEGEAAEVDFVPVDIEDDASLDAALRDVDAVVHTAGPFQGVRRASVLEAAIRKGNMTYVDVADETELVAAARNLDAACAARGVLAATSCGIWPGASALMAMECVEKLPREAETSIDYAFFTAGTGGAGPTIVSATFLLLVTPALVFRKGEMFKSTAWTEARRVNFGGAIGERTVRLLDCPDVFTVAQTLGRDRPLGDVSSRFSTAPEFWNLGFGAAKSLLPPAWLSDRTMMQSLAVFSEPIVRAVDALVGSANVMRITASSRETGRAVRALHHHRDLEDAVGIATAAFTLELTHRRRGPQAPTPSCRELLTAGVRWPAEFDADLRAAILRRILDAPGTIEYSVVDSTAAES